MNFLCPDEQSDPKNRLRFQLTAVKNLNRTKPENWKKSWTIRQRLLKNVHFKVFFSSEPVKPKNLLNPKNCKSQKPEPNFANFWKLANRLKPNPKSKVKFKLLPKEFWSQLLKAHCFTILKDKSEKQLILSIFQADDMGHYVWMVFERVLFDVMTWLSMGGCVEVWLDSQREASVKHMKWKKTFEIQLQ